MNPIPATANTRIFTLVERGGDDAGDPITSGTVNTYVVALTGTNSGKWFQGSDQTWKDTEAIALAATHKGDGHWTAEIHADCWIEGVRYLEYAKESGDLHVPLSRQTISLYPSGWTSASKAPATLAAGDVSGEIPADVVEIGGTAVPETAGKLHVLDGDGNAVAPAGTALDKTVWTDAKAVHINADIDSRAPADTALSKNTWTDARAGYIDNLNELPPNFSDLAITETTGRVTVGTSHDKTDYALTAAYDAAKNSAPEGAKMDIVDAPNATAVAAIQDGLSTFDASEDGVDLNEDQSGVTVGTVNALAAGAVQGIWDALTSALDTAGSIGQWILDKLNVAVDTRSSHTAAQAGTDAASKVLATPANKLDTDESGNVTATLTEAERDAIRDGLSTFNASEDEVTTDAASRAASKAEGFAEPGGAMTLTTAERSAVRDGLATTAALAEVAADVIATRLAAYADWRVVEDDGAFVRIAFQVGTANELYRKALLDIAGDPVASVTTPVAGEEEA